jgi:hypothetical protein
VISTPSQRSSVLIIHGSWKRINPELASSEGSDMLMLDAVWENLKGEKVLDSYMDIVSWIWYLGKIVDLKSDL